MLEKAILAILAPLIAAIEANTAALLQLHTGAPAAGGKKKKDEPAAAAASTPAPETPAGPTVADFRAEAEKLLKAEKLEELSALNKKYGVKRITEVVGKPEAAAALADLKAEVAKIGQKAAPAAADLV